tara:strand:- start:92 stop:841 length:750 start_codon:yes stop_codon:yes gene_type:complete
MTNKHLILSNRVVDMSYKKIDNSSFELVDELEIEVQQIINEDLLKRPTTTINFLKSVAKKLKISSDYLLNEVSIPIQKKLSNKIELSDIEKFNFEEAGELGIKIDEIIDNIINNIGAVSTITKKEPQPEKKENHKFSRRQVALILTFEKATVRNPDSDKNEGLKRIVFEKYDFKSKTSARQIYFDFYKPIQEAIEEQKSYQKIVESICDKQGIKAKTLKRDIEGILNKLNDQGQKEASEFLKGIHLLMN